MAKNQAISGVTYIVIGTAVMLMSVFIDYQKLMVFILTGAILILVGFFKSIYHHGEKKHAARKAHRHAHHAEHHTAHKHAGHGTAGSHHPSHPAHPQHNPHTAKHSTHAKTQHIKQTTVLKCASCGVKLHPKFKFCPNCGQKM